MHIEEAIKHILVDDLFVEIAESHIGTDDSFRDVLGIDSLGFTELRTQCEGVFGVDISDEDFVPENFSSVRTLARLVERLRSALPDQAVGR